jgi:TorS N-terminal sensor domain
MTAVQAQGSSLEINKTLSRQQMAFATGLQNARFGIKIKLFVAFFSLATLTALVSAIAWYVFRDIDRAVERVTVESVPGIITALSSAEKSAEIAAAAPALMAVGSQEERVSEQAKLEERARALVTLIDTLISSKAPPEKTLALSTIERETTTKIKELNAAVEKRLRLETERQAVTRKLSSGHADFLIAIEPLRPRCPPWAGSLASPLTASTDSARLGLRRDAMIELTGLRTPCVLRKRFAHGIGQNRRWADNIVQMAERVGVEPTFADHGCPVSWRSAECRALLKRLRDDAPHPRPPVASLTLSRHALQYA